MDGSRIIARRSSPVGIRNSAREKSPGVIREALRELIARLRLEYSCECKPTHIAAGGMISSSLGLAEVRHVDAPAGFEELAAAAEWHKFEDVCELPILLVSGVRCGSAKPAVEQIDTVDAMRGEETLCAGLAALGIVSSPGLVLNLGSHWKAIHLDDKGRVSSSVTSLAGELIHAAQQSTILADSMATSWPDQLSRRWVDWGMESARQSGLARALFCVRLLDLSHHGTPEDRLAFTTGAFIASDLKALRDRGTLDAEITTAIVGGKAVAEAWQFALSDAGIPAEIISPEDSERAFLTALRLILEKAHHSLDRSSVQTRRTFSS